MNAKLVPPSDLVDALAGVQNPIVVAHVVPDADALGSMFSMVRSLRTARRRPLAVLPDGSLSQRLGFLLDMAQVPLASTDDIKRADGIIALDTAKQPRCNVGADLKNTDWVAGRTLINVDHHATNTRFGSHNWVEDHAGSTCEMLFYLLRQAELEIDAATATLLYAGMNSDTLGFTLPGTSSAALAAAAELVDIGADVETLGERLYRSQTQAEFDLQRIIYANTKTAVGGAIAYSSADYEEIHNAGCTAADIDDQITIPRSLDGARLAMLFTEGNRGKTRINFRGSGKTEVLDLAVCFNGGGHRQAAGAILDCGIEEAMAKVLPEAARYLETLPAR